MYNCTDIMHICMTDVHICKERLAFKSDKETYKNSYLQKRQTCL